MQIVKFLKSDHKRAGAIISLICIAPGLVPLVIFTFFPDPALLLHRARDLDI